ncbi:MAG TPA: Fe-S cluster assembly protein SufD [Anaerolineales bacterium]|nr:Fe-S cluster assembly protein SufD [Anaerolineales bacterium]
MSTRTVTRRSAGPSSATAQAQEFAFTAEDVERISAGLNESPALRGARVAAWERFAATPMPTTKDEAWRRTALTGLDVGALRRGPVEGTPADSDLLQPLTGDSRPALMVLRPGMPTESEGEEALAAQGVVFADWRTAVERHGAVLEAHLGKGVSPDEGKFAALAAAMAEDGVLVYVPAGLRVHTPLHSVLWAPSRGRAHFTRVLVVVEDGAEVTYVHETASPTVADGQALHAGTVELLVGARAKLTFVELQNWGEHVWNFTHERSRVGRDGRLDWIFGAVGSRLTKNFTSLDLEGEGAEGRMSGFYFADGVQHLDHDTQQNHGAPHTTSDLLFKGALVDRSRSVWQGMIYVAPGAQKTDGYQANRNLLLSPQARADSIPGLEILADDVRCTHGATVGQLEQEPIFYLMTRGLPRSEAERMVVDGFFAPVLERIPFEQARERFRSMIDAKMAKPSPTG